MELSQVLFLVVAYETAVLREAETAELPPSVLLCVVRVPLPLLMWCTPRLQSVTCSKRQAVRQQTSPRSSKLSIFWIGCLGLWFDGICRQLFNGVVSTQRFIGL
jgi:hypothetical protein